MLHLHVRLGNPLDATAPNLASRGSLALTMVVFLLKSLEDFGLFRSVL